MQRSPKIRILNSRTKLVTTLPLEAYLRFVVPAEMPDDWPKEAQRAQAVACRSYAEYARQYPRHSIAGADVCDSPRHCQLYRPDMPTSIKANDAIASTYGLICTFNGKVAETMYHAACGDHTIEQYHAAADGQHILLQPYLAGVACNCGTTKRNGHGLGMCQAGARAMALDGASYVQILQWYYQGISIEPMEV